jgi:hypothetical protein
MLAAAGVGAASAMQKALSPYHDPGSCGEIVDSIYKDRSSDVYRVAGRAVLCDADTDSGGWTLVSSGHAPPADYGGEWYSDLTTLLPSSEAEGSATAQPHLWYDERLSTFQSDIRFSCSTAPCRSQTDCSYTVDIAFYQTAWYKWIANTIEERRYHRCTHHPRHVARASAQPVATRHARAPHAALPSLSGHARKLPLLPCRTTGASLSSGAARDDAIYSPARAATSGSRRHQLRRRPGSASGGSTATSIWTTTTTSRGLSTPPTPCAAAACLCSHAPAA